MYYYLYFFLTGNNPEKTTTNQIVLIVINDKEKQLNVTFENGNIFDVICRKKMTK